MMEFKDIQPRNFIPSRGARDRGEKRREHVMLIGGRDGPAVAGLPPRDSRYWSEGEQARWTRELESDSTYPDAKTQSRLLREVRPEQRLYGRGYMKVGDMSEILMRNLTMTRGRPVPIELTLVQENGELLALPLTVKEGPVFTGLLPTKSAEEYRGVPITWNQGDGQESLSDILAAAGEFAKLNMPIIVTGGDGSVTRALAPRVEGTDLVWVEGSVPLTEVRSIDLLDPTDMDIQDKPFFARLVGVMGEFEGMLQLYPYFLIARLRAIRQRREGLPVPQAAMFLGDTTKTEKVRQKAEKHLKQFTELTWARRLKKFGKDPLIFDVAATDPVTGFKFLVDQDKNLYWASAASSEFDPVALLRPLYPGTGAILVNVDDYLRLLRMSGAKEMTGSVKSNPSRGPMRNFMNPVHYMSDRELEIMAAQEGLSVSGLLSKYAGRIKRKSERPSKSKNTEMGYLSAGRRAAQTGAGLKITRRNSGWDPVMYEIEPGIVYEPDVTAPPEFLSNPFQKVTEPGPGKIQVTSKRGKTLYMTQNQIAKMGHKMLAPGEVERALSRSNPRTFRGEQTPERRKRDTKEVRRRTAERKASMAGQLAAYGGQFPRGYASPDAFKGPARRKYPAGHQGSAQRQRKELAEFSALLPDIPVERLKAMDIYDIIDEMDARGVMHPSLTGMATAHFIRENPRTFRGGMSGQQRGKFDQKRSRRHLDANMDRSFRREDEATGEYDEAEFQKFMGQLGLKGNPRRR
jgi:hypothetical protein